MKRKLSIALAAVAAAASVLLPADLASAEDASGRICTDLQNAIDYHQWRSGTKDPDGRLTADAEDSLIYIQQLRRWSRPVQLRCRSRQISWWARGGTCRQCSTDLHRDFSPATRPTRPAGSPNRWRRGQLGDLRDVLRRLTNAKLDARQPGLTLFVTETL